MHNGLNPTFDTGLSHAQDSVKLSHDHQDQHSGRHSPHSGGMSSGKDPNRKNML